MEITPERLTWYGVQYRSSRTIQNRTVFAVGWMAKCWSLQTRLGSLLLRIQPFIFCHLCHVVKLILFWLFWIVELLICGKLCHEEKLQAFSRMQMTGRNQPQTFQNRRFFRELNNVTLAELPTKLLQQTLASTCSLRVLPRYTLVVGIYCSLNWHY